MVRARLLELLCDRSYRRSDTPSFRLTSGKLSDFYIDCKATTMWGEAMPFVGEAVGQQLPSDAEAVGGLTMGADWIAAAAAYWCQLHSRSMNAFSVRKEPKKHGLRKWIEGCVQRGAKVVVVDDVVTTGGSTIDAINKCREEDLQIIKVVVLIDRQEENGLTAIRKAAGSKVPVEAIFTRADFDAHFARARADAPSKGHRAASG